MTCWLKLSVTHASDNVHLSVNMKRLHPQWTPEDEVAEELAAAAKAEEGLEELADLFDLDFKEPEEQQHNEAGQAAPVTTEAQRRRSKRPRRQLVSISFGSQEVGASNHESDPNPLQVLWLDSLQRSMHASLQIGVAGVAAHCFHRRLLLLCRRVLGWT